MCLIATYYCSSLVQWTQLNLRDGTYNFDFVVDVKHKYFLKHKESFQDTCDETLLTNVSRNQPTKLLTWRQKLLGFVGGWMPCWLRSSREWVIGDSKNRFFESPTSRHSHHTFNHSNHTFNPLQIRRFFFFIRIHVPPHVRSGLQIFCETNVQNRRKKKTVQVRFVLQKWA